MFDSCIYFEPLDCNPLSLVQLVLESHRWVPLPAVGFPTNTVNEESREDVTPPSYLMEHPPLAVFINGVLYSFSFYPQSKNPFVHQVAYYSADFSRFTNASSLVSL